MPSSTSRPLLASALLLLQIAVAAVRAMSAAEVLSQVPPCASDCISSTFLMSTCEPEDVTSCICSSIAIQAELSACVQTHCPFGDQLTAAAVEGILCEAYPKESRRPEVRRTLIVSCSFVFLVVALRLFTRIKYAGGLWGDDYTTIFAAVLLITLTAVYLHITSIGFGMHYWTIPVGNGVVIRKMLYVGNIVYVVLQAAVKLLIVLFLHRIFPSQTFRRIARGIVIVLLLHGTLFTIPFAVQCTPVQSIWDRTITDRRCLNLQAVGYSSSGLAMAEDVAILLLPIPHVWQLKVSLPRRLAVIALFSVGSFTTFDETWDHVDIVVWSFIEQSIAMLCASLPTLRLLLVKIAPRRRPASLENFFFKENSPGFDKMRQCRIWTQKGSDPAHRQIGEGVLVTTTVDVDRQPYRAVDLPPCPPPACPGPRNSPSR
ncbi:putative integral membrane protein [Colletotrichum sublineola]|uniref:Putative integral membrane protein n=1 Tax=Colletotrichum sublineola TaxID=1173701 RepID=A0A066X6P1_COLSU|nr:putative integral membrane protein [Colletotrichum sublineola]